MPRFHLRFSPNQIERLAGRYFEPEDAEIEHEIAPRIKKRGRLSKADLLRVCAWKTPRSRGRVETNSEEFVEVVTATALSTSDERLRIEVLTLLNGVGWPTASVILHFGHREPYPILDVRALWSLGIERPPAKYDFLFWWAYTQLCRRIAEKHTCSMRTLDRALWQYSKERQGRE
jgi:hypothetical protein